MNSVQIEAVVIDNTRMGWKDVVAVARHGALLTLSDQARARIDNAQAIVQRIVRSVSVRMASIRGWVG